VKYQITHTTEYHYSQAVGLCQNEARLQPRNFGRQYCDSSRFDIKPSPSDFRKRLDFFGNHVAYFAIQQAHTHLSLTVISDVTLFPKQNLLGLFDQMTWEQVRDLLQEAMPPMQAQAQSQQGQCQSQMQHQNHAPDFFDAQQYLLDSTMVATSPELTDYARSSFQPNRPLLEVVQDLMARIYKDFTYDPNFTSIATPLSDVLHFRRGVCQDFAHLAIACLRAYGIAARYVSGYVETIAEPGKPRLVGADASHAWFSVYSPRIGWLDFDPTNNTAPLDQHITLAWGRDYADVTPLKGIAFGGGQHTLSVSVDVLRLE
jgi:transglutaminase-like putative cysteine protease